VSNDVIVLFGLGNGSVTMRDGSIFHIGFDSYPYGIAVGDVDKDHLVDIVVTNDESGNVDMILEEC
jgi:hypothetical protein